MAAYDVAGQDNWFGLTLDPDDATFWAGNTVTDNVYRINLATGAVVTGPIPAGAPEGEIIGGILVVGENQSADLLIEKTVDLAAVAVGETVTFTVTATNLGPDPLLSAVVSDGEPAGLTFLDVTPSQGTWNAPVWDVGALDVAAAATLTIVASVRLRRAPGQYRLGLGGLSPGSGLRQQ